MRCVLPRPMSDHFPILLNEGGLRRGPSPFRFENMWLKVEGFKDLLKLWWEGDNFSGSSSFILAAKLKALKSKLKEWNKDVFGRVEARKDLALNQGALLGCSGDKAPGPDNFSMGVQISHLLFADDTLVFCQASQDQLTYLSWLLMWFEAVSGLRINLEKCELILVGRVENIDDLAMDFG
ncbi:hypothetical protein AAG906_020143 [Vitis piasezkii]